MTRTSIAYLGKLPEGYRERFSLYCEGVECCRIEGSHKEGIIFFQSESEEEKDLWNHQQSVMLMNEILLDWMEECMERIRSNEIKSSLI